MVIKGVGIRILPPDLAALIAAGEVIERPAAAVKELVENAIDAGARRIEVEIEGAGLTRIAVTDDGCGIPPDEAVVAFERHATSKIGSIEELGAVRTLGFRGEALASIAAAADVELRSRTAEDPVGVRVRFKDGVLVQSGSAALARGTRVEARRLFARQPARLKFLRSPASEAAAIAAAVTGLALGYPEIRFALTLDGRRALETTGSGELRDAVRAAYGAETTAALLALDGEGLTSRGAVTVDGQLSPPHLHRGSRGGLTLLVNRRLVQSRRLAYAVESAYQGMLPVGRHPIAVVRVTLPPDEVDVNVHPAKAEVRFRYENEVFAAVERAARAAVSAGAPVPAFGTRNGGLSAVPAPTTAAVPAGGPERPPTLWERVGVERPPHLPPDGETPARRQLPALRVVGQMAATFVVAEGPDGMYLVDQHAAHERVTYERLLRERAGGAIEVQGLLDPPLVMVTPRQEALLSGAAEALVEHGFTVEPFGDRAHRVRALPALLAADADPARAFIAFLDDLDRQDVPGDRRDRVVMSLACHGSVRKGKVLVQEEMRELLLTLESCEAPRTCPHGRPTMVHFSAAVLEREFGRR